MYGFIYGLSFHVYRYCFVLVSCHGSAAVVTLYSKANWLAEVTERYLHLFTS